MGSCVVRSWSGTGAQCVQPARRDPLIGLGQLDGTLAAQQQSGPNDGTAAARRCIVAAAALVYSS